MTRSPPRIVVQDYPRITAPHYDGFTHKTDKAFDIGEISLNQKRDIDHITGDTFPLLIDAERRIAKDHCRLIRWR